ncbi:MAG: LytS/YhcK type 5TM receptor domain-containing protein [Dehalococcoidales bacterium]|nr:LytS/YhcK type 5TM receptor domain-containing protein [Dehalococcoidales bacterium]
MLWIFKLVITIICLVILVRIVSPRDFFHRVLNRNAGFPDKLTFIVIFGLFSVFCTYMGTTLPSGAIINVRDMAPMLAGLIGGPLVGLGTGLIGGIHRFFLEGFTQIPCSLATILIGLTAGCVNLWIIRQKGRIEFIKVHWAALFAVVMELCHMGLILLFARPFDEALEIVKTIVLSMTLANTIGVSLGLLLIKKMAIEKHILKYIKKEEQPV